ncbi:MAG: aminotransferase class III-fold pyridoxal phosphate-dependent enzyme [Caldilinea sp.]
MLAEQGISASAEWVARARAHNFFSWSAQDAVNPIAMVRGEGCYFWDADGRRYFDLNSQSMCMNIGHGERRVIDAIKAQAEELAYAGPGMVTRVRVELGEALATVTPPGLDHFFYGTGGADANENAVKMARAVTGRHKILARYRSYHGATYGAMSLTGDQRRWASEPGMAGVVRYYDPYKYRSLLYREGDSDDEFTARCLAQIEETLMFEGPHTVAAILMETVTGTNGVIVPPDGYLQGVRALCDRYGILLICDEVMTGFGRTGAWFGVDHWGVVPDMITMAKGLTSAYLPLSAVAVNARVFDHFRTNVFYGGLTYSAHPICLAAALATLRVIQEDGLIGNAAAMGRVLADLLDELKAEHPAIGDVRSIGLLGCIELVKNRESKEPLAPYTGGGEVMPKLAAYLREHGVYTYVWRNLLHTNPPLCVTEEQLREVMAIVNDALTIADGASGNV